MLSSSRWSALSTSLTQWRCRLESYRRWSHLPVQLSIGTAWPLNMSPCFHSVKCQNVLLLCHFLMKGLEHESPAASGLPGRLRNNIGHQRGPKAAYDATSREPAD